MRRVATLRAVSRAAPLAVCAAILAGAAATPLAAATAVYGSAGISISGPSAVNFLPEVDFDTFFSGGYPLESLGLVVVTAYGNLDVSGMDGGSLSASDMGTLTLTSASPFRFAMDFDMTVGTYAEVGISRFDDPGFYDFSVTSRVDYQYEDGPVRTLVERVINRRVDCTTPDMCDFSYFEMIQRILFSMFFTEPGDTEQYTFFAHTSATLTRVAPPAAVPLPAGLGLALSGLGLLGWLRARR